MVDHSIKGFLNNKTQRQIKIETSLIINSKIKLKIRNLFEVACRETGLVKRGTGLALVNRFSTHAQST